MSTCPSFASKVEVPTSAAETQFSICVMVSQPCEYAEMVDSFVAHGFTPTDCEYLYIDNSKRNVCDAFVAYNHFLAEAKGEFIILCHQDVRLLTDDRRVLEERLKELSLESDDWALCGNVGGVDLGRQAARISDPHGHDRRIGNLPAKVTALDENFILAKRSANLALSRDVSGFHLYGADLCVAADFLGWSSWVIDFHLLHKSPGNADEGFFRIRNDLAVKYRRAFRSRWVVTPSTAVLASGAPIANSLRTARISRVIGRYWAALRRAKRGDFPALGSLFRQD